MESVVLVIHLILALGLIGVVLMQRSEGGGLGIGGGGDGMSTGRSADSAMSKLTWILAAAFIVTSIGLTMIATQVADTGSALDSLSAEDLVLPDAGDTAPTLGNDLLPPSAADELPLTPSGQ